MIGEHPGDLISGLLDGELDDATAQAVVAHLAVCDDCSHERDEVDRARQALRGLGPAAAPPGTLVPRPALHLGEVLSGLLDDELEPEERERAEAHIGACLACDGELREVRLAREAVRSLPRVDAPPVRPGVAAPRKRRPRAALLGAAAAALGTLGLAAAEAPVAADAPALPVLMAEHESGTSPTARFKTLAVVDPRAPSPKVDVAGGPPASLPPSYRLVAVERGGGRVHAMYEGDGHRLSLFSPLPTPRLAGAPGQSTKVEIGDRGGNRWVTSEGVVVTWSSGGDAYAIITDAGGDEAVTAAASVPPGEGGLTTTARRRCRGVVGLIG